uniref:Uncharacterized protein n=1 Tax=Oscillatoriales cyanobacterium SpSt-418 TaxID=2282169 RepID=A0A7C3PUL2_9CYAN
MTLSLRPLYLSAYTFAAEPVFYLRNLPITPPQSYEHVCKTWEKSNQPFVYCRRKLCNAQTAG